MMPDSKNLTLLRDYLDNDSHQIKEMIELFLETIPEDLQKLITLNEEKDFEKLRKTAHRMKSPLRLFDMNEAADILQKLELDHDETLPPQEITSLLLHISQIITTGLNRLQQQLKTL